MRHQPFASPGEALEHYGVKGMHWGVRKQEDTGGAGGGATIKVGTPEHRQMIERITRTDHQQVVTPSGGGQAQPQQHGLSRNQKLMLAFGAATAAAAGYYAYNHYVGQTMPGLDLKSIAQHEREIQGLKLPKQWDVSGLKNGPISSSKLGDLAHGQHSLELLGLMDRENLVVNTSRGYADILPKDGFSHPFAAKQHANVVKALEEMRDRYPAVRNLNVEVVPMSKVNGMAKHDSIMSVLSVRPGEARVVYNDIMDAPTKELIHANRRFLPGMGHDGYTAYHEMGHLLAVAHGELPPTIHMITGDATREYWSKYTRSDPILHKLMFAKHGFTFKELSRLSQYAATEPAEAMAELAGHYFHPEMRKRLTADQITRAKAMFDEMGGLT